VVTGGGDPRALIGGCIAGIALMDVMGINSYVSWNTGGEA
jgi:hypothetical protein